MLIVPNTFLRSIYFLLAARLRICIIFIWSFTAFASGEETFRFSFSRLFLFSLLRPPHRIGLVWENYRRARARARCFTTDVFPRFANRMSA